MAKIELTPEDLQVLSECINEQKDVPAELLTKLSPGFFEKLSADGRFDFKALDKFKIPTIEYAGKRPESVILAQAAITGGAAPLQVVRSFANGKNGDWKNLLVQGDNLQFLKTCYLNQDPLIKDKVKGKVKLIYIDPPFATEGDFVSGDGIESYSDKINRSEFLESLRERLIYIREILDDDGSIYLHCDWRMNSYIRLIMDDVFGRDNFLNEVIWCYGERELSQRQFNKKHDNIYFYARNSGNDTRPFNCWDITLPYSEGSVKKYNLVDDKGMRYQIRGKGGPFTGKQQLSPEIEEKHPDWTYRDYFDKKRGILPRDWFSDITFENRASLDRTPYPTQKPSKLLERIITVSSNRGDLVMDIFAGSGTTAAVAEKLGRRWIMCDFGKHAIYTMQKRLLNIAASKKLGINSKVVDYGEARCKKCSSVIEENDEFKKCKECGSIYQKEIKERIEKYGQPPKPFCVVSAGAYDFTRIMDLRKNQDAYVTFVLGLFNIVREKADFSKKYKLPNIYAEKNGNPVEVFPVWDDEYLKNIRIDEEYLQGIIDASGGKLKGDYYLITPETCARVGDTTLKNAGKEKVNFRLLKFPYKVLEELSRHFQIEEQAASSADINRLISSMGFYFNEEVKIEAERRNGGLKIAQFNTGILNKSGQRFKGLEGLAMILVDVDYDGGVFDMDAAVYNNDIGDDGVVKIDGLTKNSHIIAIDKHGNESKVTKIK
jgi:DNA modification methylase